MAPWFISDSHVDLTLMSLADPFTHVPQIARALDGVRSIPRSHFMLGSAKGRPVRVTSAIFAVFGRYDLLVLSERKRVDWAPIAPWPSHLPRSILLASATGLQSHFCYVLTRGRQPLFDLRKVRSERSSLLATTFCSVNPVLLEGRGGGLTRLLDLVDSLLHPQTGLDATLAKAGLRPPSQISLLGTLGLQHIVVLAQDDDAVVLQRLGRTLAGWKCQGRSGRPTGEPTFSSCQTHIASRIQVKEGAISIDHRRMRGSVSVNLGLSVAPRNLDAAEKTLLQWQKDLQQDSGLGATLTRTSQFGPYRIGLMGARVPLGAIVRVLVQGFRRPASRSTFQRMFTALGVEEPEPQQEIALEPLRVSSIAPAIPVVAPRVVEDMSNLLDALGGMFHRSWDLFSLETLSRLRGLLVRLAVVRRLGLPRIEQVCFQRGLRQLNNMLSALEQFYKSRRRREFNAVEFAKQTRQQADTIESFARLMDSAVDQAIAGVRRRRTGVPDDLQMLTSVSRLYCIALFDRVGVADQWNGVVVHDHSPDFHRAHGGIINVPYSYVDSLEHLWILGHECGHEVADLNRFLERKEVTDLLAEIGSQPRLREHFPAEDPKMMAWELYSDAFCFRVALGEDWPLYCRADWYFLTRGSQKALQNELYLFRSFFIYCQKLSTRSGMDAILQTILENPDTSSAREFVEENCRKLMKEIARTVRFVKKDRLFRGRQSELASSVYERFRLYARFLPILSKERWGRSDDRAGATEYVEQLRRRAHSLGRIELQPGADHDPVFLVREIRREIDESAGKHLMHSLRVKYVLELWDGLLTAGWSRKLCRGG